MTIARKCMFAAALALLMLGSGSAFASRNDSNYSHLPNYAESFENLAAWGGSFTNVNISNGWYSTSDDLSTITNMTYTAPACGYPLPAAAHTNVLRLKTEGTTLTNTFTDPNTGIGYEMSSKTIFMDTMIQFVASEDKPASCVTKDSSDGANGIKAAVYADVNTNLMIYCGVYNTAGSIISNAIVNTGIKVNATTWYRLTIRFDATFNNGDFTAPFSSFPMFQVLLDGVAITNNTGYAFDDNWQTYALSNGGYLPTLTSSSVGSWFPSGSTDGNFTKLMAIGFQGTGYIDDLVVTNAMPHFNALINSYFITTIFDGNGTVNTNGLAMLIGSPNTFSSDGVTSIVYTAHDWYRINTLQVTNGTAVAAAHGVKVYTQMLGTVTGNITNTVAFYQPPSTNINVAYTNVTTAWLAGWGQPEATTPHDNGSFTLQQEYLLNVNPFIAEVYSFHVTSIAVTNSTVDVSVQLTTNSVTYASTLNGVLALYGQTNLATASTQLTTTNLVGGSATLHYADTGSNNFYKVKIQ